MIDDHLDIRVHVVPTDIETQLGAAEDDDQKIQIFHTINVASGQNDWDGGVTLMVLTDQGALYYVQAGLEGDASPEKYFPIIFEELIHFVPDPILACGLRLGAWGHKIEESGAAETLEMRSQFLVTPEEKLDSVTVSTRNSEHVQSPDYTQPLWQFAEFSPGMVDLCTQMRRQIVQHNTNTPTRKDPADG